MNEPRKNPLAVITGASSGIGYALSVQFAQHGYDLLIVSSGAGIFQAAEKLKEFGVEVQSFQCDLATFDGVEHFYRRIKMTNRPVAALALNAGVGVNGRFDETSLMEEFTVLNLNVVSTVHLAKLVIKDMVEGSMGGKILITSSVAATTPGPYMAIYNASKAFVQSFAEALHYELKEKGITVTALMPDATDTHFFERAGMQDTKVGAQEKDDPTEVARQGFEALMNGKDHVFAGSLKHRIMNPMNDLMPEQTKARIYAQSARPGSAAG